MYLDDINGDSNEFKASTEVTLNPDLSNKKLAKPITTDDIASKLAKNPSWTNHGNTRPIPINCSKKKDKIDEANASKQFLHQSKTTKGLPHAKPSSRFPVANAPNPKRP